AREVTFERTTLEGRVTRPRIRASTPEEVPHEMKGKMDWWKLMWRVTSEDAELIKVIRKHADAFAWVPVDMIGIPLFVAEHELKTYPHIEPKVQRKRSIAPDKRKVVKEEVEEWPKSGIIKRVRYPSWASNPVLVKKSDDSWRMCIDFKDLNKACPKDLYPLPEIN
ncbi:hypothetical protein Tco_0520775, partial [Tanacetum coccineum]